MENFIFCAVPVRVNVLSWQIRFYLFELAAIHSTCSENVYSLSSENNQGKSNILRLWDWGRHLAEIVAER